VKILRTKKEVDLELRLLQNKQISVGLVPTMGALHEGHLDLVRNAKESSDMVLVSIFVNPTQFNNSEDFEKYPHTLDKDLELLDKIKTDYVFVPNIQVIYPHKPKVSMRFEGLDDILEGEFRPGHFNGVGIVVLKLLNIVKPQKAYFGQKDLQQVAIIKQLVADLSMDVKIVTLPTVREKSGLAMSSRNLRLSPEEKESALVLFRSLIFARDELLKGKDWFGIRTEVTDRFKSQGVELEYFEFVNTNTLEKLVKIESAVPSSVCTAAYVGQVRLIDNMPVQED
jgi:pantoate--beta-alanine ligase